MVGSNFRGGKSFGLYENAVQCNGLYFYHSSGGNIPYIGYKVWGIK